MSDLPRFELDFERLLSPISEESPSGESLRYDGTYDRIQEARRREDPSLEQGIWQRDLKAADWSRARDLCVEALSERSKDLQIGAWLLEALLHAEGFRGIADGFQCLLGLCERFWDTLHPQLEDGDLEGRLATVDWIDRRLSIEIRRIPISKPTIEDAVPLSWSDWEAGLLLENAAQKNPKAMAEALAEGKVTKTQFVTSCTLTQKSHFVGIQEQVDRGLEVTNAWARYLDENCGKNAPGLVQVRKALGEVRELLADILSKREDEVAGETLALVETGDDAEVAEQYEATIPAPASTPQIRSRDEAYRVLSQAADYLLRTEPHSPTPYLVKRAVAWGQMPLGGLLTEIVRNDSEREELFRLLRIGEEGESSGQ